MNENWISQGLVETLDPSWSFKPKGKPECGRLGKKGFQFLGGMELHYTENKKSKYAKCRVVPGNSFGVLLQCALLPPSSSRERAFVVTEFPSTSLNPALTESPLPTISPLTAVAGSFDGLLEAVEDNSKEYEFQACILTRRLM
jgi:hypothetical protein